MITDLSPEVEANVTRWNLLALIYGYNELSKVAKSIGEKLYCRVIRREAVEEYRKLGGSIELKEGEASVVTLTHHIPHINLYPRDIELMREAVAEFDRMK